MKMLEKNLPETMKVRVYHQHTEHGRLDSTVAVVYDVETGDTMGVGRALVNHRKEKSPSRKMGRKIAVGRAMRAALGGMSIVDKGDEVVYTEPSVDWERFAKTGDWV